MPRMYLSVETSPFISTSALPATTAATACCTHLTSLASSTMLNALMSMSFSAQTCSITLFSPKSVGSTRPSL
jgi:hypothetical protein